MAQLSSIRGIDFLQARSQVVECIRRAIKKQEDSNTNRNISNLFRICHEPNFSWTLLPIPAVCCLLLIVSLAFQSSTHFIPGLLVSLTIIIAVVFLNVYLYQLVSTAESIEIRRELEGILHDYEEFSNHSAASLTKGTT